MKREFFVTADGSSSFKIPEWDEQYHSRYGAIQEAKHVFIESGLIYFLKNFKKNAPVSILEIGFGTGLNALLTALYASKHSQLIRYTGIEAFPLNLKEIEQLNYPEQLKSEFAADIFKKIHRCDWKQFVSISPFFELKKVRQYFEEFQERDQFDLIYFDAFGARVQPELWKEKIFKTLYKALHEQGVFVTYSAKGSVRRALGTVGFEVQRTPGPPGKREMIRALKAD